MRLSLRPLIAAAAIAFTSTLVHVQTPAPLADARFDHISVAVHDFERTLPLFAEVLGIDPPAAAVRTLTVQAPDGSKVLMKLVDLNTSDFDIEVDQPNGSPGPTQDFLDRFGQGIQHFGQAVTQPLAPRIQALTALGGRWTLGPPNSVYAFVDMMPTLGTTIDLEATPSSERGKGVHAGGLASYPVDHIGFLSPHAEATAKAFADVLGGRPSPARRMKDMPFKVVQLRHAGMTVEIAEPVGSSGPGAAFVARRKGPGAHHIAFDVGGKFNEFVGSLQAKGGKLTLGRRGSGNAWLDFTDSLGLVIELIDGAKR